MADAPIDAEAQALVERLKSALWLHIGTIVDSETLRLECNATPQFIGALTELVWAQIESAAIDTESFASHAGRSTIKTDDVLLLARRNEGLEEVLKGFVADLLRRNEAKKALSEERTSARKAGGSKKSASKAKKDQTNGSTSKKTKGKTFVRKKGKLNLVDDEADEDNEEEQDDEDD